MNIQTLGKEERLAVLATKRKQAKWNEYKNLCDFHDAVHECDFVSPYTKTAGNVCSKIFVMLQDWASEDGLRSKPPAETVRLGYTPDAATNINLHRHLREHFGMSISDVYATNLFPFIKSGSMSARIHYQALLRAAKEFALPQIEIVGPRLVIVLGMKCFNVLRETTGSQCIYPLSAAIENPIDHSGSRIWCQAHTGWGARHRGGAAQVTEDWRCMAAWFHENVP